VIANGANSLVALTAKSAADGAVLEAVRRMLTAGSGPPQGLLELRTTILFNPAMDHQHYALPAQIGFIVYQISLAVASIAFTRERELGTLEQLLVTPIRRAELVLGKAAPSLFIGLVNFLILLVIVVLGFRVSLRGSFPFLFGLTVIFVLAEISWGIMISSVSRTQQEALLFVFMLALVDMTLSGYLVSPSNMPPALQALSLFAPLRHYLVLIRSIMLKGPSLPALWPHVAALIVLSGASLSLGTLAIARRLD
jgi:ABC-2 type transport system permease protein